MDNLWSWRKCQVVWDLGTACWSSFSGRVFTLAPFSSRQPPEPTPGVLESLVALDNAVSEWLGVCAYPRFPGQSAVKYCCLWLELLGHGLLWYGLCALLLPLYLLTSEPSYLHHAINMFLVLTMDVMLVAPVKLAFRRPRPRQNTGTIPMSVSSVDKYAFPSGHASRCMALAAYFCYTSSFPWTAHLCYTWALVVSLSRILIGRHHLSDVLAGMLAGLFIFQTVCWSGLLQGCEWSL